MSSSTAGTSAWGSSRPVGAAHRAARLWAYWTHSQCSRPTVRPSQQSVTHAIRPASLCPLRPRSASHLRVLTVASEPGLSHQSATKLLMAMSSTTYEQQLILPRRFWSSVADAPCGPGRVGLAPGPAAPGRTHGRARRRRRVRSGPRCSCHICATSDGVRRSAAVTPGRSAPFYLDRSCRSSPAGLGNRSSKLVMRFRLPSPALWSVWADQQRRGTLGHGFGRC